MQIIAGALIARVIFGSNRLPLPMGWVGDIMQDAVYSTYFLTFSFYIFTGNLVTVLNVRRKSIIIDIVKSMLFIFQGCILIVMLFHKIPPHIFESILSGGVVVFAVSHLCRRVIV